MKKLGLLFIMILFGLSIFIYTKEKQRRSIFYNFGQFGVGKYDIHYHSLWSDLNCNIGFPLRTYEGSKNNEELKLSCQSDEEFISIENVSNVLDAFLDGYDTKQQLMHINSLSLQVLSNEKYYFLDFIQELNYLDSWNKKGFYSYLDRKKQVFLFGEYMDHLEKVIKESNTFNPLYEVLEKHGCQVDILSNSLSVELFDRSYIDNILVPQYYLYDTLLEDGLLNKEDANKTIYPHIGMMFFDLKCK